ncbi:MAG: helix-turn-helix transcriptional regulator [Saprospiraceae bacterium]|nr:helix-turn-helix transcriptional regulator [Saprospiraceae bacterium]
MAYSKKSEFKDDEIAIAEFAKAISHPARVAILKEVAMRQSCICGEIVEVLPLAQSTVSQHLKELKAVGLIDGTVEGAKSCYCINWAMIEKINQLFNQFFEKTQCCKTGCS